MRSGRRMAEEPPATKPARGAPRGSRASEARRRHRPAHGTSSGQWPPRPHLQRLLHHAAAVHLEAQRQRAPAERLGHRRPHLRGRGRQTGAGGRLLGQAAAWHGGAGLARSARRPHSRPRARGGHAQRQPAGAARGGPQRASGSRCPLLPPAPRARRAPGSAVRLQAGRVRVGSGGWGGRPARGALQGAPRAAGCEALQAGRGSRARAWRQLRVRPARATHHPPTIVSWMSSPKSPASPPPPTNRPQHAWRTIVAKHVHHQRQQLVLHLPKQLCTGGEGRATGPGGDCVRPSGALGAAGGGFPPERGSPVGAPLAPAAPEPPPAHP